MKHRHKRRGMTLLETGVALLVMTAAIMAVVELVSAVTRERRLRRQRQVALLELANEAERIALLDWEEITSERLSAWNPSEMLQAVIPTPRCQVRVSDEADQPRARRVDLSVGWQNAAGEAVRPATLTIWKYAQEDSP
jgi:type II secretory pathway pseudopilin PulG